MLKGCSTSIIKYANHILNQNALILFCLQLVSHGFSNIDALDGSQAMLDKAREKNIYQHYENIS